MSLFKEKKSFFGRLSEKITDVIMARSEVDEDLMDELEEVLITSDIGMDTTMRIMEELRSKIKNDNITNPERVTEALKNIMIPRFEETVKFISDALDEKDREALTEIKTLREEVFTLTNEESRLAQRKINLPVCSDFS